MIDTPTATVVNGISFLTIALQKVVNFIYRIMAAKYDL
jgi:hypothetical protein